MFDLDGDLLWLGGLRFGNVQHEHAMFIGCLNLLSLNGGRKDNGSLHLALIAFTSNVVSLVHLSLLLFSDTNGQSRLHGSDLDLLWFRAWKSCLHDISVVIIGLIDVNLAHTPEGKIIGQVTIAPADDWWEGRDNLYEIAVEVSSHWRHLGIARALLTFALELDILEESILFATGLSWHWDLAGLGISPHHYRQLIAQLFASQGFEEYSTTQPDIRTDPANIFLARIGKRVALRTKNQIFSRLSRTRQFYGL